MLYLFVFTQFRTQNRYALLLELLLERFRFSRKRGNALSFVFVAFL